MLRKFSNSRTLADNIQLGTLTALSAGMTNVASLIIFFSFSSNVTGYYTILAAEIVKGNLYNAAVVMGWLFLFFAGSFVSNFIVIHNRRHQYLAHSIPIFLEIGCLLTVGIYGQSFYKETLAETEILLALMLFAMGLQNGLTASISNFAVKTTHLTGATTDLAILLSMFTSIQYRKNRELRGKAKLLGSIFLSYVAGAIISGLLYFKLQFAVFYVVCVVLLIVLVYDYFKVRVKMIRRMNLF